MKPMDISRYPSRRMTVVYGDGKDRSNLFRIVTTNTNDQSSLDVELLPDEAKRLADELVKFLVLAALNDPDRYGIDANERNFVEVN